MIKTNCQEPEPEPVRAGCFWPLGAGAAKNLPAPQPWPPNIPLKMGEKGHQTCVCILCIHFWAKFCDGLSVLIDALTIY